MKEIKVRGGGDTDSGGCCVVRESGLSGEEEASADEAVDQLSNESRGIKRRRVVTLLNEKANRNKRRLVGSMKWNDNMSIWQNVCRLDFFTQGMVF